MSERIKITVAAGIGDGLWNLMTLDKSKTYEIEICKSNINRGKQIYDLMDKSFIADAYYSDKVYPKDCDYNVNHHLEAGKRIEDFNGTVNYKLPWKLGKGKGAFVKSDEFIYFGIYTSNIHNNKNWKGWANPDDWKKFMDGIKYLVPNVKFVGIGAEYDDLMDSLEFDYTLRGEPLAKVIKTIKNLDFMFGYPSGIPILAEYFGVNTFMFFPDKLNKMQNSFCRKESIGKEWKGCSFTYPHKAVEWIKNNWL